MNVLLVTWSYPPFGDGAEKQAKLLATALGRHGLAITVLTPRQRSEPCREVVDGVTIVRIPSFRRLPVVRNAFRTFWLCLYAGWFVARHHSRFSVLHCVLGNQFTAVAIGSARLVGLPSIARMAMGGAWNDIREMRSWPRRSLGPLFAPMLTRADRFVVLTPDSEELLARDVPANRIRCIPNAIEPPTKRWSMSDLPSRRTALGFHPERDFVFAAGRLVANKGFDVLIRALANRQLPLFIAGQGTEHDHLTNLARDLGVDLHLLGKIPSTEVESWMLASSALVAPSYVEGISNTVLEAAALGCPIVASSIPGNQAVIDDAETGLLVEPGNVDELQAALWKVLNDTEFAARLGDRASKVIPVRFSVELLVNRYVELYKELAVGKRH